jgi:hypothetical protein
MVKEHPKNLSLLTSPWSGLSEKKQNATTNNGCNTYYYDKINGIIMWSMYAWYGNYDAMQLIHIKRNQNPGTHIYDSSCFSTRQFKCSLAWQRQDRGELHKIKCKWWNHIWQFTITPYVLIRWYANYHVTTWCKMQTSICMTYSNSTLFLKKIHTKYFLFRVTN